MLQMVTSPNPIFHNQKLVALDGKVQDPSFCASWYNGIGYGVPAGPAGYTFLEEVPKNVEEAKKLETVKNRKVQKEQVTLGLP